MTTLAYYIYNNNNSIESEPGKRTKIQTGTHTNTIKNENKNRRMTLKEIKK